MNVRRFFYGLVVWTAPVALSAGCGSSGGNGFTGEVGTYEPDGGSFSGADDSSTSGGLDAHIEENDVTVTFVTLTCTGPCADVVAVPTGGHAPYTFAWDDGPTNAMRQVCPSSTTNYSVRVTDTGTVGEFPRPAETVQVPLAANVIACPDGGVACMPGNYVGTWNATGLIDAATGDASPSSDPSGPLALALVDSTVDGGGTELAPSGNVVLNWDLVGVITAHLSGGLDCATGTFRAEDPVAANSVGLPGNTCDATFTGQYDPATGDISGRFAMKCWNGDWGGTWTVALTP
jgi:hypothetical protein